MLLCICQCMIVTVESFHIGRQAQPKREELCKVQLKKVLWDMLVLALLTQNDRYGYEIVSTISEYIEISEGTIYPLFNRLKKESMLKRI